VSSKEEVTGFLHRVDIDGVPHVVWNGEFIPENSKRHKEVVKAYMAYLQKQKAQKAASQSVVKERVPQVSFLPDGKGYQSPKDERAKQAISDAHAEIFHPKNRRLLKERPFKSA